mmetsp:Transcript_21336/g.27564  ORF Transcript_21336/g.27564 Transcript_21336/m.27564 type:complete len:331 (+) Transcript_21336:110-1102(+)
MTLRMILLILFCTWNLLNTDAFLLIGPTFRNQLPTCIAGNDQRNGPLAMAPRYGPPSSDDEFLASKIPQNEQTLEQKKVQYRNLVESILAAKDPQHIPSLLAKNMDLLLTTLTGNESSNIVQSIVDESRVEEGDQKAALVEQAIDLTFTFAEDFVKQASQIDQQNKELLGKILKTMSAKDNTSRQREESLDDLFTKERENLTAGFLRHVEAECERIEFAPKMTPDSARLLETLRVIQARVVEELGEDLGEGAQVLGQLIGYETSAERIAVLEAGLTVRGISFARELKALTVEALDGFQRVQNKADPELVEIIKEIDNTLLSYLEENSEFE